MFLHYVNFIIFKHVKRCEAIYLVIDMGELSIKVDMCSYGVVLMEIIMGRKVILIDRFFLCNRMPMHC